MTATTLQTKINSLPPILQQNAESYIDFLLTKSNISLSKNARQPIDFSKYSTKTNLWSMDAQAFIKGLRNDERF